MFIVMLVSCTASGLAQIIWAQLAITLGAAPGAGLYSLPRAYRQLSFLFWGWFKTLLTYSLVCGDCSGGVPGHIEQVGVERASMR